MEMVMHMYEVIFSVSISFCLRFLFVVRSSNIFTPIFCFNVINIKWNTYQFIHLINLYLIISITINILYLIFFNFM